MSDINIESGKRLRFIREIMNEGGKLSADQFAFIFDESKDKIINYELGRTQIPIKLLNDLYSRGFNPNFIITGNENVFLDTEQGRDLQDIFKRKINSGIISTFDRAKMIAALESGSEFYKISEMSINKVAAGKIRK